MSRFPTAEIWNKTRLSTAAPRPGVLHEIFETQADARPTAVAVMSGRDKTTYAELERRANRLGSYLRRSGVRRGSVVGILLPRSTDAYVALLGILKAGAAYVPIDPEYPGDRIAYILEDSGAHALVTAAGLLGRCNGFGGAVVLIDADRAAIDAESPARLTRAASGVEPEDLCYVIYTSGSTGRPKGVMIEHRNVWHLVHAEAAVFAVHPQDRVAQIASLAFDLSVEEVWLAWCAGAALVASPEMGSAGPDLSRFLVESGVTVLSCVPTFLSMLSDDVPLLRLLILGGEACSDRLVARWARVGRRIVNTYGPTETTVIATYTDVSPHRGVTIGRTLPGYRVYLLDGACPVPRGEVGEICIGGTGVGRGYVGLPRETSARFVPDPFAPAGDANARMYRTGDLGRIDADGNLEFLGRLDDQVKLRGFRVELAEIESMLMRADGVLAAACVVREDVPGVQELVGYVVPRNGSRIDDARLRLSLRTGLPAHMIPAVVETVAELPRLPSGKLDRASLPPPRLRDRSSPTPPRLPRTATERRIAEAWEALFGRRRVSVDDDFFLDLGGHSLLVARMVSDLRKDTRFARLAVRDVYENPTIARLATAVDAAGGRSPDHAWRAQETFSRRHRARDQSRYALTGALQTVGLYGVLGISALQWVAPYLVYFALAGAHSALAAAAWAGASAMAVFPVLVLAAVAIKWLVLGRVQPGRHPLWGGYYLRWWFVQTIISALPLDYLAGTPLLPIVYRLLGARIGKDVHLCSDNLAAFDLASIGDGASIDDDASLFGYTVEDGSLVIGPVRIGLGCFVGTRAVLCAGTAMEDGARLEDLSLLSNDMRIPKGETWAGSPARRVPRPDPTPPPPPSAGTRGRAAITALYAALLVALPILLLAAIGPGTAFLIQLNLIAHPLLYLGAAPVVGASFVVLLLAEVVLLKRLLVGRVRPGMHPVHGGFYVRHWIVDRLLALSLDVVAPLYATVYLAPWYRMLGARLGRFVELSTATSMTPDLLEVGEGSTIADEASLGAPRVERGWMTLAPTRLGRRAFVGNSAVVPAGTVMGDETLVGVLSIPPSQPGEAARSGASWLGSPPLLLPRREPSREFSEERTFYPSRRLRLARGAFEILRVTFPPAGFIIVAATVVTATLDLSRSIGWGAALGLLPLVYAGCGAAVAVLVALAKWIIIGRFRPFACPLWSMFIWRLELVNALFEFLVAPLVLEALRGTPLLPCYFRLLGARIGRCVYVHTTGFLEFDLVDIGDRAILNDDCVLQTHLFEDRVLKASPLRIGADCVVGAASVVLYHSVMENGARLDPLSLLMKGEVLPAESRWRGIPARLVE